MEREEQHGRGELDSHVKAVPKGDAVIQADVVRVEDDKRCAHLVKDISDVLLGLTAEVSHEFVSSLLSMLYSASFDMEIMKAHIPRSGNCRKISRAHETESIVGSCFVEVEYRCERASDGTSFKI